MNPIVDLLIGNLGAVIVIAVAAISLLGKLKVNTGNPAGKRPVASMPSFGGGPGERELPSPSAKPTREWESSEGVSLEGEAGRILSDSLYPVAAAAEIRGAFTPNASVPAKPSGSAAEAPSSDAVIAPDKDDLRRAVLWAEILGPPRAKRPHGR